MLTRLDDILYPNKVEVIDFSSIGKFFYPVFKCGNSTLRYAAEDQKFRTLVNEQIRKLDLIDVFVRDPRERYRSAVQTYMYYMEKENVDFDTVYYYLRQGIMLDRHLVGQLNWIINLARYMNPQAKIQFHSMAMLDQYCKGLNLVADKLTTLDDQLLDELVDNPLLKNQFSLDQIILDELVGDSWTVKQIIDHLKERDLTAYTAIIGKAHHVLSKI